MARKILRPAKKQPLLIRNEALLQQKREAVMEAAFALFLQQGFHSTTTRDIARRAGVSAGAPFTYFKDKEEILFYIVSKEQDLATEQLIATLSRQIAEATHNDTDPEEVFKTVFTTWLHAVDVMRRYILLAYQETKSLNSETQRALMAREKRLQTLIGEAIRYGAERGRFSPDNIALKAHNIIVLGSGAIRKPKTREGIFGGTAQAASTASQICGIQNCGGQRPERSNWPFLIWCTNSIPLIVMTA